MSYKEYISQFFQEFDKPSDEQFLDFFDRILWKDETMPISFIEGLRDELNDIARPTEKLPVDVDGEPFIYTVPAGYLVEMIILEPSLNCSPWCDYVDATPVIPLKAGYVVTPANGDTWLTPILALKTDKQIQIHNMPIGSFLYFIRRKLP